MMRNDQYPNSAIAVAPSDTTDLAKPACGLMAGTAGDIAIVTINGDTVILKACAAGIPIPIGVIRVKATGTTATNITAFLP